MPERTEARGGSGGVTTTAATGLDGAVGQEAESPRDREEVVRQARALVGNVAEPPMSGYVLPDGYDSVLELATAVHHWHQVSQEDAAALSDREVSILLRGSVKGMQFTLDCLALGNCADSSAVAAELQSVAAAACAAAYDDVQLPARFFNAQLVRLSLCGGYRDIMRRTPATRLLVVKTFCEQLPSAAAAVAVDASDANLNVYTGPADPVDAASALLACYIDVIMLGLYRDLSCSTSVDVDHTTLDLGPHLDATGADVEMEIKQAAVAEPVCKALQVLLTHAVPRAERTLKLLGALLYDWSYCPEPVTVRINDKFIPVVVEFLKGSVEPLVHRAANCIANLTFRNPGARQHLNKTVDGGDFVKQLHNVCVHWSLAAHEGGAQNLRTLFALQRALINTIGPRMRDNTTLAGLVVQVSTRIHKLCRELVDHVAHANVSTVAIRTAADAAGQEIGVAAGDNIADLVSQLSRLSFQAIADDRRKEHGASLGVDRAGRGLWTMRLLTQADVLVSLILPTLRRTLRARDVFTCLFWLGEDDSTVAADELHRLCMLGLRPARAVQELGEDEPDEDESDDDDDDDDAALRVAADAILEELAQALGDPLTTLLNHDGAAMPDWKFDFVAERDDIQQEADATGCGVEELLGRWIKERLNDRMLLVDGDNDVLEAVEAARVVPRIPRRLSIDIGGLHEKEVFLAAFPTSQRNAAVDDVVKTLGLALNFADVADSGKLWFHGCTGARACNMLSETFENHLTTLSAAGGKSHDIGADATLYLSEHFDTANVHACRRATSAHDPRKPVTTDYAQRAGAVLVFQVPNDELLQRRHVVVPEAKHAKCLMLSSRWLKRPTKVVPKSIETTAQLTRHLQDFNAAKLWMQQNENNARTVLPTVHGVGGGGGAAADGAAATADGGGAGGAAIAESRGAAETRAAGPSDRDLRIRLAKCASSVAAVADDVDWVFTHMLVGSGGDLDNAVLHLAPDSERGGEVCAGAAEAGGAEAGGAEAGGAEAGGAEAGGAEAGGAAAFAAMFNPATALTWAQHLEPVPTRPGTLSEKAKRKQERRSGGGGGGGGGDDGVGSSAPGNGSSAGGSGTGCGGGGVRSGPALGQLAVKATAVEMFEACLVAVLFFEDPDSEAARRRDASLAPAYSKKRADNIARRDQTTRRGNGNKRGKGRKHNKRGKGRKHK